MKKLIYGLIALLCLASVAGCGEEEAQLPKSGDSLSPETNQDGGEVPEGYFVASFSMGGGSRALTPTVGSDTRVQHIRHLIFRKDDSTFVKENILLLPEDGVPMWPFDGVIRDTLPKGEYIAIFLGNASEDNFEFTEDFDILTGYRDGFSNTRIWLPPIDFSPTTEYYMGETTFSDTAPNPSVMLQRIIGAVSLHRNTIQATDALNMLTSNIINELSYGEIISDQLDALLPGLLGNALDEAGVSNITGLLDRILGFILEPIAQGLLDPILKLLINELGTILTGNSDQAAMLSSLDMLVNPWALATANTAIVTVNNFPRSIDFDHNLDAVFEGENDFAIDLSTNSLTEQREIFIRGFEGTWEVKNLNVIKAGLVSGLVVDGVADNLLLPGSLVDIKDDLDVPIEKNRHLANNYSLVDMGLESYDPQEGAEPLKLNVRIGDVLPVDELLGGIPGLGTVLNFLLDPIVSAISDITIPIELANVPLLGINNLTLTGSWGAFEYRD